MLFLADTMLCIFCETLLSILWLVTSKASCLYIVLQIPEHQEERTVNRFYI